MNRENPAELAGEVAESGYPSIVLQRLADQTKEVVGADHACIFVCDRDEPGRAIAAAATGEAEHLVGTRLEAGSAAADSPERCLEAASRAARRAGLDHEVVPIPGPRRTAGTLAAGRSSSGGLTPRETRVLRALASTIGPALGDSADRERQAELAALRLDLLSQDLAEHDADTDTHSEAVVRLAVDVGRRLGFEVADLLELELAAWLHDLGKLRVPGEVLRKPGPLSTRERRLVQRHPVWGARLLSEVPGLQAVATIIRLHHERWDGNGYPHGVAGERIPRASRVVAACDAFDAMTTDRPYRKRMGVADALAELRAQAGCQFDRSVVDALDDVVSTSAESDGDLEAMAL